MPQTFTLGHSPDPDDAFMFYGLAKELIPTNGYKFTHILQDIQTLNERATRGELDITAISIHAYAYVSSGYALLPSGASMGDGYGPMLVSKKRLSQEEVANSRIAVPGTMTSAFLALQLWLQRSGDQLEYCRGSVRPDFPSGSSGEGRRGFDHSRGATDLSKRGIGRCAKIWARGGSARTTACPCRWAGM